MKRTNVVVDEQLLEEAMRVTNERTYSGVINKSLEELVRVAKLRRAIHDMAALGSSGYFPNYIETIRPNAKKRRAARSANDAREPRVTAKAKRGSR